MNEYNEGDELFRNRIKAALQQLNEQPNGFDSNASIEAELAEIAAAPMSEPEVARIMDQVHRSIVEAAKSREGVDRMQNRTSSVIASPASEPGNSRHIRRRPQSGSAAIIAIVTTSFCLLTAYGLFQATEGTAPLNRPFTPGKRLTYGIDPLDLSSHHFRYVAQPRPQAAPPERLIVGQTIRTAARERRRVLLPDGSILYLNEQSTAALTASRTVALHRGQLFVEVTPASMFSQGPFVVETPDRSVTALGTKFAVSADDKETEVLVTQGKVRVSGANAIVTGGQVAATTDNDQEVTIDAAPRASQALSWTRELIAAAETAIIPRSDHEGGALVVVDPSGQEMRLSLRKFHVDAHIEDGFARTTIDQTYFNHTHSRQEGTFKFPLPPDASLSRLAMYVNGKLMEGGMVERDHGRNVFEQIMHTKRDPALLEWVDGSTFKMRVFPLEPREEKRIVLSYTQRLPNDYDRTTYRFPAGHSLDKVRDWSTRLTVANGSGTTRWFSPTHLLKATDDGENLVLEGDLQNAVLDKDLVVELTSTETSGDDLARRVGESIAFSGAQHEGYRYQMLRFRPDLNDELERPRRNWVFLYESSGDRNPLLARVQLDVISTMLEHAEHDDTFSVISAATKAEYFRVKPVRCSKKNIDKAIAWLEDAHLVGALDLEEAFSKVKPFCRSDDETMLVHVGSATPVLGERDELKLLRKLPADVQYVGVGVGKRWSRTFMRSAASQTGGHFTQINPDEKVNWRAFELLSTLNAPRLLNLKVDSGRKDVRFLTFAETISHGQEIAAVTRLPLKAKPLSTITVTGTLNGKPFTRHLDVSNVRPQANYLPRTWARLEIDRLVSAGADTNKDAIITLSKAMYVMSPFTSLLVLEDEAMYEQFNVDRGRKDHWALYPAPQTIQVVREPGPTLPVVEDPVVTLERKLKLQKAKRDVARANVDLGIRDGRTPDEIATLKSQLTQEQHAEEQLQRRLELARYAAKNKVNSVVESVLYRRPPTITVPTSYVRNSSRQWNTWEYLGTPTYSLPASIEPEEIPLNSIVWRLQQADSNLWMLQVQNANGVLDESRDISGFDAWIDLPLNRQWGTNRLDLNGRDFRDKSIQQQVQQFELGYRMLSSGQGIDSRLLGGLRPEIQAKNYSAFRFGDPGPRLLTDNFSLFDDNGDGYLPQLWDRRRSVRGYWNEPSAIRGETEFLIEGRNVALDVRLHEPQLRLELPSLSTNDFEFDAKYTQTLRFSPHFGSAVTTNGMMPSAFYDDYFPGNRFENADLYGKVPVLNSYHYISSNLPTASLDDVLQFRVELPDFGTVNDPVEIDFTFPAITFANASGFIPLNGLDDRLDTIRLTLPDQSLGFTRAYGEEVIQLPIRRPGVLRNILSYAPGMQTSPADILAVVESEVEAEHQPERGTIDARALQLIKKSRSLGWQQVELTRDRSNTTTTLLYNGKGDIRLDRRTKDGLLEQVVADGSTLWHLYPELGIGSRRTISRFHRQALLMLTPWLIPPAKDLATGCLISMAGENTIRILSTAPTDPNVKIRLALEIVFREDGRVSERRLINLEKDKPLTRQVFGNDGSIRTFAEDGQLLSEVTIHRTPVETPTETPETDGLVILPLPYRSADSYSLSLPAQPANSGSVDYSQLSEADAMKLVATHVANSEFDQLWNVINQRFVAKDDSRMGFAVLLSASSTGNSQPIHEVASHNQGASALGSFLVQHFDWWKDQDHNKEFVLPDSASPFLKHLVDTHNVYALWSSGRATRDRTESQVNQDLSRALELIRQCPSKQVAWMLLKTVHQSINETFSQKKLFARLATEAASFENEPGMFGHARHARVLWLISAGRNDEARQLYSTFRLNAARAGLAAGISEEIRSAFIASSGNSKEWSNLILSTVEPLVEQKRSYELLQLALQCSIVEEPETAQQLLNRAIADVDLGKHPDLLVTGLQCLLRLHDWKQAEEFTRQLMRQQNLSEQASLWRTASQIASELDDDNESLRRLEQAMRLELAAMTDVVNVEALRGSYNTLFDRFTAFVESSRSENRKLPEDFVNRITQAADAWRSIDPDPTQACQRAARLLQTVGLYDDAWKYWTTPLVNLASSSDAWRSLANALQQTNQIHLAGRAWSEAFSAEPTNPELLWNHAELLRNAGQTRQARQLLQQIVNGKWQPRFANVQSKARSLLQNL